MSDAVDVQFRGVYLGDATSDAVTTWTYRDEGADRRPKLTDKPTAAKKRIDPYTGRVEFGSQSLRFARDTTEAELFESRNHTPGATLNTDLQPGDTSIQFQGSQPFPDGQVIHVGWETIQLGSYDSSLGVYTQCTRDVRGFQATQALPHDAGAPVFDDAQGVPFWQKRIVKVDDPGYPPWYGIIRDIDTAAASIGMSLDAYYGVTIGTEAGRQDRRIPRTAHNWRWKPNRGGDVGLAPTGYVDSENYEEIVHKPDQADVDALPAIQIRDSLFTGFFYRGDIKSPTSDHVVDVQTDSESAIPVEEAAYKVLVGGKKFARNNANPFKDHFDNPSHPITILRSLLESTYGRKTRGHDVLQGPWGAKLNTAGTAEHTHPTIEIDQLLLGWDGESRTYQELIKELAVGYGFTPTFDDGVLDFERFGTPTVEQSYKTIDPIPGTLEWDEGLTRRATEIEAQRMGFPWEQGRPISISLDDAPDQGPAPAGTWADQTTWTYQYPSVAPEQAETGIWPYLQAELIARIIRSSQGRPTLGVKIADASVEVGDWVQINSLPVSPPAWVVDRSGDQVEVTQSNPLIGWVTGQRPTRGRAQKIEILIFFQDPVKKRCPTMLVTGTANSTTRLYCSSNPEFGSYDRSTGSATPDNESFEVGQEVSIFDFDLAVADGTAFEILDIGSDGTGPYLDLDGAPSIDPTGRLVRLTNFDDYTPPGDGLEHVYIADDAHTLGADDQPGHLYGR